MLCAVSVALLIGVLLATTPSIAVAGYTPANRPTYDYNRYDATRQNCDDPSNTAADHGRCGPGDGPVFNSFISTPSYGDERAFFDGYVSSQGDSSTADRIDVSNAIGADVVLRIYVNDANEYGVLVRTLSPAANRADRGATTQPVDAAAGTVGDRWEPGRLPLVALSRWP